MAKKSSEPSVPEPVINLQSSSLTHTRRIEQLHTIVIIGPDNQIIARYENIFGHTRQEAIAVVRDQMLYEAHPS